MLKIYRTGIRLERLRIRMRKKKGTDRQVNMTDNESTASAHEYEEGAVLVGFSRPITKRGLNQRSLLLYCMLLLHHLQKEITLLGPGERGRLKPEVRQSCGHAQVQRQFAIP